jgi:hypothetical protein
LPSGLLDHDAQILIDTIQKSKIQKLTITLKD